MADTSGLPPEGWYPDRPNAARLRHWTGAGWTNEFRPIDATPAPAPDAAPAVAVVPKDAPVRETTDQARSRRELRAQVGTLAQGEPDTPAAGIEPMARATPQPVVLETPVEPQPAPEPAPVASAPEPNPALSSVARARAAGGYAPIRQQQTWQESFAQNAAQPTGSSQTFAGWLYAASPLWLGALLIAGMTVFSIVNPLLVQAGLAMVGFAMTFLLARQDIRQLKDSGYRPPSLWWVLLPLLYFVVRMVRVGLRGAGMVVTYLISAVALSGLLYFALMGNLALLSAITPSVPADSTAIPTPVITLTAQERATSLTQAGTEAELRLELAKTWEVGTVECVPFPSTDAGTTTTCVVQLDGVSYNAGLEVTPDQPGAAFLLTGMLPVP
ncbi:MAG: hypothetical protein JWR04_974 [Rhodoglobus sp.]|nr:hypothetical protein [Rhodoglobus sp.]